MTIEELLRAAMSAPMPKPAAPLPQVPRGVMGVTMPQPVVRPIAAPMLMPVNLGRQQEMTDINFAPSDESIQSMPIDLTRNRKSR